VQTGTLLELPLRIIEVEDLRACLLVARGGERGQYAGAGTVLKCRAGTVSVSEVLDTREYKGLWWLPGDESERLAGTLTITNGEAALELLGHFGRELLSETERERAYSLELADQPRIVGLSTDGKAITLEGDRGAPFTENIPGIPISTYRRNVTLIGKRFADGEEIGFDEVAIRASDLDDWTRVSGFHGGFQLEQQKTGLVPSKVEVTFDPPDDVEITLSRGETAFIRFTGKSRGIGGGSHHVALDQEAALHLRFRKRTSLHDVFQRVTEVRNFLSLAVGRPVAVLSVTGFQDDHVRDGSDQRLPIELLWGIPYNPDPPTQRRDPREMLFTLPEADPDISTVMKHWFAKQARLTPVFNLFFGVRHHSSIPLEVRFLSYAQAVETYDYRRRRRPGKKSLAQRMDAVLRGCRTVSKRIVGRQSEDQTTFIQAFKTTRNYYTHYDPKLEKKAARGSALYVLFVQLQAIIEMSFLHQLGFPCRSIDDILERARRYEEIRHFKALAEHDREKG
jgi:hypothetical protein